MEIVLVDPFHRLEIKSQLGRCRQAKDFRRIRIYGGDGSGGQRHVIRSKVYRGEAFGIKVFSQGAKFGHGHCSLWHLRQPLRCGNDTAVLSQRDMSILAVELKVESRFGLRALASPIKHGGVSIQAFR